MTVQHDYTTRSAAAALRVTDAWTNAAKAWSQNIQKATEQLPTPSVSLFPTNTADVVKEWFDFTERVVKVNRDYLLNLAGVAKALTGAVRQHVDGLGEAVRDQAQAVSHSAKDHLEKVADAEREQL